MPSAQELILLPKPYAKRLHSDLIRFNYTVSLILDRRQQRLTRTFVSVVAGRISILHLRTLSQTIEAANAVLTAGPGGLPARRAVGGVDWRSC